MKKIRSLLLCFFFIVGCSKDDGNLIEEVVVEKKLPVVVTNPVTDISTFSITVNGKLIEDGDSEVEEVGFVIGDVSLPTIQWNLARTVAETNADNDFYIIYESIPANTVLYIRAYAINSFGISYGEEIVFNTLPEIVNDTNNIYITNQEELEALGAENNTRLSGNLYIRGVSSLEPLHDLVMVDGEFNIEYTDLINLDGLENLKQCGGSFQIMNNQVLNNFEGLSELIKSRNLIISRNPSLVNLGGINKLVYLHGLGSMRITENINLENVYGLNGLQEISMDAIISYNPKLKLISGLSKLEYISYTLNINDNPLLENLIGLQKLKRVGDIVRIQNNDLLTNLYGLNNLEEVGSALQIRDNDNLINMEGLEKLTSLQGEYVDGMSSLYIQNNKNLINLNGLENLTTMLGSYKSIRIIDNENLSNYCGLKKLVSNNSFTVFEISNNLVNTTIADILANCL